MSSVEDTTDALCIVLEGYTGGELEDLAQQIIVAIDALSNDLLDHLDPPLGLRTWLASHGLSLVHTRQVSPPAVWDALQGEEGEEDDLEEEPGESLLLQVGGLIEYRTAPSGPRGQSQLGSGRIVQIGPDDDAVVVETGPNQYVWIDAATDFIRSLSQPDVP